MSFAMALTCNSTARLVDFLTRGVTSHKPSFLLCDKVSAGSKRCCRLFSADTATSTDDEFQFSACYHATHSEANKHRVTAAKSTSLLSSRCVRLVLQLCMSSCMCCQACIYPAASWTLALTTYIFSCQVHFPIPTSVTPGFTNAFLL